MKGIAFAALPLVSFPFCHSVSFVIVNLSDPLNFNPPLISSFWLRAKLALTWMGLLEYHTWYIPNLLSYLVTNNILLSHPLHFYVYISRWTYSFLLLGPDYNWLRSEIFAKFDILQFSRTLYMLNLITNKNFEISLTFYHLQWLVKIFSLHHHLKRWANPKQNCPQKPNLFLS